jgi:hypothetical protein
VVCGGGCTYTIPEPVRRGRQTNGARADGKREDLANNDPGSGAPGGRKEEYVDADEGNLSLDGLWV